MYCSLLVNVNTLNIVYKRNLIIKCNQIFSNIIKDTEDWSNGVILPS